MCEVEVGRNWHFRSVSKGQQENVTCVDPPRQHVGSQPCFLLSFRRALCILHGQGCISWGQHPCSLGLRKDRSQSGLEHSAAVSSCSVGLCPTALQPCCFYSFSAQNKVRFLLPWEGMFLGWDHWSRDPCRMFLTWVKKEKSFQSVEFLEVLEVLLPAEICQAHREGALESCSDGGWQRKARPCDTALRKWLAALCRGRDRGWFCSNQLCLPDRFNPCAPMSCVEQCSTSCPARILHVVIWLSKRTVLKSAFIFGVCFVLYLQVLFRKTAGFSGYLFTLFFIAYNKLPHFCQVFKRCKSEICSKFLFVATFHNF